MILGDWLNASDGMSENLHILMPKLKPTIIIRGSSEANWDPERPHQTDGFGKLEWIWPLLRMDWVPNPIAAVSLWMCWWAQTWRQRPLETSRCSGWVHWHCCEEHWLLPPTSSSHRTSPAPRRPLWHFVPTQNSWQSQTDHPIPPFKSSKCPICDNSHSFGWNQLLPWLNDEYYHLHWLAMKLSNL